MIILKSKKELDLMRQAGRINAQVLETVREAVRPGITTIELNAVAEQVQVRLGAEPVFKGYTYGDKKPPFPTTITACINEELVHGIPGSRQLQEGDLLSIDCASRYQGYIGDSAFSVMVGQATSETERLLAVTERALYVGIENVVAGNRVGDIAAAIQQYVEANGFNVVRGYGGHGVGRTMHEDPHIPNYGIPGKGPLLRQAMTFAIEPMVLQGNHEVITLADQWTVIAKDRKLTAHFEHTVVVTDNGPEILTCL
ncbi:MAG: type I methionyl aminopeptidase [Chloroflexi bacterium]|nr:type I methionyl aminopeptidase [Chloroflexota bacterium]MBP8058681.1 type I methionyl aminopeptidase [Chloroflexota bacterium]